MVIPVHDENPARRRPYVTWALLALNVVVFLVGPVATSLYGTPPPGELCRQDAYFREYGAIPRELVTNHQLARTTAPRAVQTARGPACVTVRPTYDKQPALSVASAMFLHGGWLHLLGNMLFLWVFGNNVEDRLGRVRFAAFYLACGYAAAYAYALLNAGSVQPLVGASGAVAGVLGAYLLMYPRAKVTALVPFLLFIPVRLPAWIVLGTWFLLQAAYAQGAGLSGATSVAYSAHVAGFLAGLGAGLFLASRRRPPPRRAKVPDYPPDWR